jgi:threonine/homoserine/homoserine lactone efflux protein
LPSARPPRNTQVVVEHLAAFVAVSVVVIVTPGPDTALTIRNTLVGGRAGGVATAVGVAAGQATWTLATSAGISALLVASEPAFLALRVAGAAYLVYLGLHTLLRRPAHATVAAAPGISPPKALRQGVLSNLGNPKMAVFFTSLLPQFVSDRASFAALLGLGLIFCSLTLTWLTAYAFAVAKAGDVLLRGRVRRALDVVTGTVLVALGVRIAAEHR